MLCGSSSPSYRASTRTSARPRRNKQRIDQSNEFDLTFIDRLVQRNGVTFYERNRKLYLGPRNYRGPSAAEGVVSETAIALLNGADGLVEPLSVSLVATGPALPAPCGAVHQRTVFGRGHRACSVSRRSVTEITQPI
jgi:hypothetical protein